MFKDFEKAINDFNNNITFNIIIEPTLPKNP